MTDRFEVHARDGPARLAELRLSEPLRTPALVDDVLRDAGSLWREERAVPEGDDSVLTVLPHRAFPSGTADEVKEAFQVEYDPVDYPSAAVVSPETAADYGADAYVLSGGPGLRGYAEGFVDALLETKAATPPDSALYVAGAATPANVATMAYAGVDLFDSDYAYVRGTQGFYLAGDGEHFLEDLDELPCACEACRTPRDEFDHTDCAEHNVNALEAELARVRQRIRDGRLRDYVEGQARHEAWTTALFRRLDRQYAYVEERTPTLRRAELLAASEDTLRRAEIQRFAQRVTERYRPRLTDRPLVLVPCSARKPYSESQSHYRYSQANSYRGHMVSMTSPIGVVPNELELTYPAQHYDSVVTGDWTEGEYDFVARVLERYLDRNRDAYTDLVAHVPDDYRPICERVEESLGVEFTYTVEGHPTDDASLANLDATLDGVDAYSKRERELATVRAVADYLVGDGAGDDLFADVQTGSRYPKLRVNHEDEQLATLVAQYGTLSFTLEGARHWVESDAPTKRVEIDAFVPQGSVLAPGVVDASDDIRVGDEVVIEGPKAFAVGRAEMSGPEMAGSTRGVAVEVRHCEERE
ncbi:archaeosine synthase subunit alpha [Halosegnis marinus]|uniref:Archaeosine synthase subunit alpha n=1 Tax=Halosegnis marinus TaxID=3034023 RepID=A0ABD5ZQX4_9EURY|nr:archaeosine synthase subunit alpha [Halosegnis sp. DT85]